MCSIFTQGTYVTQKGSLGYLWVTQVCKIIKDWIYIVTANGLSFVKHMFTKEVVIIHLP